MSRTFQYKAIPSLWLEHNGRRLDCGPYMSGALEAQELLKKHKIELLEKVTDGIYHAGREARQYVDDPECGVPFLKSSDISISDLSHLSYLSRKQVKQNSKFTIKEDWSLITRSGTIGRMAYVRKDMDNFSCSEDVLRVVPDTSIIKSGYLYAYLSSRFGIPLIVSGTYGAIIQHIEPEHVAGLPVPRLGKIEGTIHNFIQNSSDLRAKANIELKEASNKYLESASIGDISQQYWNANSKSTGFRTSIKSDSLRAMNYLPVNHLLENRIKKQAAIWKPLIELVEDDTLRSGPRFKRIDADPEFGVELIGQGECFNLRPEGRWISKKNLPDNLLLFPLDGTIMIAAQGCAGEHDLFGRAKFITGKSLNFAYSQHFLRVIANENEIPRGALFAFLNSHIAYRIRKGYQVGSMQQDFHPDMIKQLPVPIINRKKAEEIDKIVREAYQKYDQAIDLEDEARALVERTIEEGAR